MWSGIVAAASDELQLVLSVQQFSLGCCYGALLKQKTCRAAPRDVSSAGSLLPADRFELFASAHQITLLQNSLLVSLRR